MIAPALSRVWRWLLALTGLSLAYTLAITWAGRPYPYGLPLFHADFPFWDFAVFQQRFEHFRMVSFWDAWAYPFTYPPATGVVFAALCRTRFALELYLSLLGAVLLFGVWVLTRQLAARGLSRGAAFGFSATVLLTCWPVGYLLNRANIEGAVAVIVALGVVAALRERWWWAATLIGLAGAMKLFPLVLLGLLLSRRRYKEVLWGLAAAVLSTLCSLAILGPTMSTAAMHIRLGLGFFERAWAAHMMVAEVGFDHSLFTLVKWALVGWMAAPGSAAADALLQQALPFYLAVTAVGGVLLYIFKIRILPMLNQLIALTVCAVLLPAVSFDYTLVHLLVPFGLLCLYAADAHRRGVEVPGLSLCLGTMAFLFSMNAYLTLQVRFAGQVRALALVVLLVAVLRFPFPWPEQRWSTQ